VKSFLDRLEKGPNVLTSEEMDEYENSVNDEVIENEEINSNQEIHTNFVMALNNVNTW
jgi:hypothetical protein